MITSSIKESDLSKLTKPIGVASDHAGFTLKEYLLKELRDSGWEVIDFGNTEFNPTDDYPDYVIPLARAVADGAIARGIAFCGSGVGASIAANKVAGVRAALIHDHFSAHQGVEDDDMNLLCIGGQVTGKAIARELVMIFLKSHFSGAERHKRRLKKVEQLEKQIDHGKK
ncbi:MAG: RpiB/LacA/LacB family sugar-phosphate isomerase [Cyclobacteriaceae bacterium]|jgi:ribose 5-phosphate isomerase B|nr:RpiB/LacA/LacB family sugar-phosphate isomerase [Cyclobacteriaceae bacterium]